MSDNLPRELYSRTSAGIDVSLWWSPVDDHAWVAVFDSRTAAAFVLPIADGERAREVFDHPYAYAARRGIPTARGA